MPFMSAAEISKAADASVENALKPLRGRDDVTIADVAKVMDSHFREWGSHFTFEDRPYVDDGRCRIDVRIPGSLMGAGIVVIPDEAMKQAADAAVAAANDYYSSPLNTGYFTK